MRAATRQFFSLLLIGALLLSPLASEAQDAGAHEPTPRIGYVDMKRLLDQAPQVQQARDRLQHEFAGRDRQLQDDESRLEALKASLEHDRPTLSEGALAKRRQEVDVLAGSVRRARERMQQQLKDRSAQELDKSWQTISNAAVEYARSHDYDLLLPSPVIYASPRVDITDAVLQRLRQEGAGEATQP